MPLSLPAEYLYFLMVVLLWTAPVLIVVLAVAWRRQRLRVVSRGILVAVPILALLAMLSFRARFLTEYLVFEEAEQAIDAYLGDPDRSDIIEGAFVGTERIGSLDYRRYRFPALNGDTERWLEIRVPPDDVTAVAWIEHVDDRNVAMLAPARLVLKPRSVSLNPAMAPEEYFRRIHDDADPMAYGRHTLVLSLRARDSQIIHPRETSEDRSWLTTDAVLDLD